VPRYERHSKFHINFREESVYAGLGIYDTMQYIKPDVGHTPGWQPMGRFYFVQVLQETFGCHIQEYGSPTIRWSSQGVASGYGNQLCVKC
jgi:hypothetical protein